MTTAHSHPDNHGEGPTFTRFTVLGYLCLLTFILYLDRVCIGQAAPKIQAEMDLSNKQMGLVFGAFTIAYGLFMVVAGRLGDRFGSRGILVAIVLWWSAFTMLTGAATGLIMLIIIRFIFGAGEAGALPNCARVIARWFPAHARGLPNGLLNTAALVGGAVAPLAAAYVIELIDTRISPTIYECDGVWPVGWRCAFVLFGFLGLVWAVSFWFWFRDDPGQHPRVNAAERDYIQRGRDVKSTASSAPPVPWRLVLSSRNVWLLGLINTCASFASYMYMLWYPKYLQAARNVDQLESGKLSSIVMAGGAIGSVLGGIVGDRLLRATGTSRSRTWIGSAGMATAALCVISSTLFDDPLWAAILTALAFGSMMMMIASWWGTVNDISGPHVATLFGLMNSMGVIGAFTSPYFFGWLADERKAMGYTGREQWDPAFWVYFAVLLVGGVAWLFVNPKRSAVEPNVDKSSRAPAGDV